MSEESRTPLTVSNALDGCLVLRAAGFGADVEVVQADARPRSFAPRLSLTLGVCLKRGPAHLARANGRDVLVPADAIILRAPGCAWSSETTAAGFLSYDIDVSAMPELGAFGPMTCVSTKDLGAFELLVAAQRSASLLQKSEALTTLLSQLGGLGFLRLDPGAELSARPSVARAVEYLNTHAADSFSLDLLASEVGANKFVLLRHFERRFGMGPHSYMMELRIGRARDLLARGVPIGDVAFQLGFADQSHFGRHFKRSIGLTPGSYSRTVRRVFRDSDSSMQKP